MPSTTHSHTPASESSSAPALPSNLLPARVEARLPDIHDRRWARDAGPVTPETAASAIEAMADLSVRAALHGQQALALAMASAIAACDALRPDQAVA
jgi:hypothetical protein